MRFVAEIFSAKIKTISNTKGIASLTQLFEFLISDILSKFCEQYFCKYPNVGINLYSKDNCIFNTNYK